jgi:hypothetical protein
MASMLDVSRARGHRRNHFLHDLDDPGHQFVAIFFGRTQVDVDIVHALFPLEKGFFLNRLGITLLEGAADLLEMTFKLSPISNIVPPSSVFPVFRSAKQGHSTLQLRPLLAVNLLNIYSLSFEKTGQMRGFAWAHGNGPARQFFFYVTGDGGRVTGNDQLRCLTLSMMPLFLTNMPTSSPENFAGGPGGEHGQILRNP